MKKFAWPILSSILVIAILLILPGFKANQKQEQFPAPIENPGIAFYANLSASGLYNQSTFIGKTVSETADAVALICALRKSESDAHGKSRQIAENIINDKMLAGHFKTYEIFFYLRDLKNYALILNGQFNFKKLAESFATCSFDDDRQSFAVRIPAPSPLNEVFINCSADRIILCHPDTSEEIMTRLNKGMNLLSDEHKVFKRMLLARPAAAAELSMPVLEKNLSDFSIDHLADGLRHVRLVAASQMTKLQLFIPDQQKRDAMSQNITAFMEAGNAILNKFGKFNIDSSGNSLFIETNSDQDLEKRVSREIMAFFIHFFVGAEKNSTLLTANFSNE